jgi:hypothetical protein
MVENQQTISATHYTSQVRKDKKGDNRMKDEEIPSLTDREWARQDELGSITEVVEYSTGDGLKQVNVTVQLISGEEIEAIEADCAVFNEDGSLESIDKERFTRLLQSRMFGVDEETMNDILKNKSSDLRNKLVMLTARLSGDNLSEEEIEKEKNLESPATSPST